MTQHFYLIKVTHNSNKNEVICYFENNNKKIAKKFLFFPFITMSKNINYNKLKKMLDIFKIKNYNIIKNKDCVKIISKDILKLKEISLLIAKLTGRKPIVLDVEQNFLVDKNWSYFDAFLINDFEIKKLDNCFNHPKALFGEISFFEAKKLSEKQTNIIIKKSVLSNLLKIPIQKVDLDFKKSLEIFVQNLFFKNNFCINMKKNNSSISYFESKPFGVYDKISEIDFSLIWSKLITNNFFNIGFETINCNCCRPVKLEDENILESSFIEVIIKEDNLFFESMSKTFAIDFHKKNSLKELRISKKKEFWFKSTPIGPLFNNQKIKLPLFDAKKLLDSGLAELGKEHFMQWHCNKNESFLSKEIKSINNKLFLAKNKNLDYEGLFIDKSFKEEHNAIFVDYLNRILKELPFHISDFRSMFFDYDVANAIVFMQESTLSKFNDFSEKSGFRVIHSNKRSAFVKGYSSLLLAKKFSSSLKLPMPAISGFSSTKKFR